MLTSLKIDYFKSSGSFIHYTFLLQKQWRKMSELNTCQTRKMALSSTFVIRKIFFKFDCLKTFPDKGSCDLLKKVCARLVSLCSTFMGLWDTNKQTDKLSITIFPRVGKCIEGNYLIRTCWPPTHPS